MLSDRCPVCLFVCPVSDVGLLWRNGWMDQDETWHAGRPRPRPHCVRWGPSSPPKGAQKPPLSKFTGAGFAFVRIIRGPCVLWPKGGMEQDAIWYEDRPRPRPHCVRWGPSFPTKKGAQQPPIFGPCLLWSNDWMDQDETWHGDRPQAYHHAKFHLDPSSRLTTIDMGRKLGAAVPLFWWGSWVPI